MYIPKHFTQPDIPALEDFIRNNGFAMLITVMDGMPVVSHIPVELEVNKENKKVLRGHLARGNNQWRSLENSHGLIVFQGPHTYISSSWYKEVNVPTWNYIAVHVYGNFKVMDDEELYRSLSSLVDKYEANVEKPITVEGMKSYALQQMKGIVGFEMSMEKIEGKWKLSQNRGKDDYENIIRELEKLNDDNAKQIAAEMKKRK